MVGAESLQAYIYIYHMGLQFNLPTVPDSITDTLPITFSSQDVLARSAPQITFSSAGPRTQQIQLVLHRQLFALQNEQASSLAKNSENKIQIQDPATASMVSVSTEDAADLLINALLTLSLPKYTDSTKAIVPPSLLIRFGNETSIRGVPSSVTKMASGAWLKNGKLSTITISFTVTETEPFSAQYIAQNGTLRNISTTLERGTVTKV